MGPTSCTASLTVGRNEDTSLPIQSGHGYIGCSEDGFRDQGSFHDRLTNVRQFGIEADADTVGLTATEVVGGAVAVPAAVSTLKRVRKKTQGKLEG